MEVSVTVATTTFQPSEALTVHQITGWVGQNPRGLCQVDKLFWPHCRLHSRDHVRVSAGRPSMRYR